MKPADILAFLAAQNGRKYPDEFDKKIAEIMGTDFDNELPTPDFSGDISLEAVEKAVAEACKKSRALIICKDGNIIINKTKP